MTEGLKRYYGEAHLHFITSSCYHQRPYLDARRRDLFVEILEEARQRFQFVVVGYVVMPEHFHLLMSEPDGSDPSWVMKWIKFRVSRRILGMESHTSRQSSRENENSPPRDVWGTQESLGEAAAHTSRSGSGDGESSTARDVWGTRTRVTQNRSETRITSERFWQHRFYDFNVFTGHKRAEKLHYMHQNPVKRGLVNSAEDWKWSSAKFYSTGEQGVVKVNVGWPEFGKKKIWWS